MRPEKVKEIQRGLRFCGWPLAVDGNLGPKTREAVRDFKMGYAWRQVGLIRRSSQPGWAFRRALKRSLAKGGKASNNFSYREFRSKGNGWIKVHFKLIRALEKARRAFGPISILSGYRDPAHNARVGGATASQHKYATAIDPIFHRRRPHWREVARLRVFSGIGFDGATGLVRHMDVRHVGGKNTTGGSPSRPTIWEY